MLEAKGLVNGIGEAGECGDDLIKLELREATPVWRRSNSLSGTPCPSLPMSATEIWDGDLRVDRQISFGRVCVWTVEECGDNGKVAPVAADACDLGEPADTTDRPRVSETNRDLTSPSGPPRTPNLRPGTEVLTPPPLAPQTIPRLSLMACSTWTISSAPSRPHAFPTIRDLLTVRICSHLTYDSAFSPQIRG